MPGRYCPLFKGLKSTCTAWVQSLNIRDDGRGKKVYGPCQKHESLTLHGLLVITRHLLWDSFMTTIKPDLRKDLAAQNTTHNDCIFLHSQNTTALQPNVFWNGILWLLVTNKERLFISVFNQLDAQNLFHNKFYFMSVHVSSTCARNMYRHEKELIVKQILCIKLVKHRDKYIEMHGQQNVKNKKQGTVSFRQPRQLPRSNTNSSFTISTLNIIATPSQILHNSS